MLTQESYFKPLKNIRGSIKPQGLALHLRNTLDFESALAGTLLDKKRIGSFLPILNSFGDPEGEGETL